MYMMQFDGTITRINNRRVAIVIVDAKIVEDPVIAGKTLATFQKRIFGEMPIALLGRKAGGYVTNYFGPVDLIPDLMPIDPRRFPWQRYTIDTEA
jgi:hypothetical protein